MLLPDTQRLLHLLAHEMRSPLSASTGYVRLLADGRVGGAPSPAQSQVLEQLRTALGRAAGIITQTATLTDPVPLGDLVPLFEVARTSFDALANQVPLELDLPDDADASRHVVAGDRTQLASAFQSFAAALGRAHAPEPDHPLVVSGHVDRTSAGQRIAVIVAGRRGQLEALRAGPDHADCCDFDIWQGGLGVSLVRAALVAAACGGRLWALNGATRATFALQLPLEDVQL